MASNAPWLPVNVKTRHNDAPMELYLSGQESIQFQWYGSGNGVNVQMFTLTARILRADGNIAIINEAVSYAVAGSTFFVQPAKLFKVPQGWLLSVQLLPVPDPGGRAGYGILTLVQNAGGNTPVVVKLLAADYIDRRVPLAWPQVSVTLPYRDQMQLSISTDSAPAAGAEISTFPNGNFRLIAFRCTLQTSAVVANRRPRLQVLGTGLELGCEIVAGADIAASTLARLQWGCGCPAYQNGPWQVMPLPGNCGAFNGGSIVTGTLNLQAGDQYGNISYTCTYGWEQ